jgi:hypothetical protein
VSTTGTDGPTPPIRVSEGTYKRLTSGVGQFALAIGACFALVLVAMLISPGNSVLGGAKEILPSADAGQGALELRNIAPYVSWAPQGLPARWRCTSSRLTTTPASWHVGYVTPSDQYAALEQSDETPPDQFISRMINVDPTKRGSLRGIREVAGVPWEEYFRVDKKQYSLVRRLPGVTLVVSGTASYDELAVMAGSLQQQPKQSAAPKPTP